VVRRWQVLEATPEGARALSQPGFASHADDPGLVWSPAYSTVGGALPLDDIPHAVKDVQPLGAARAQFDASTPGAVLLRLNATKGLTLWLDGKLLEAKETMEVNLTAGLHTLTIAVNVSERKEPLRVELDDKPGSPARVRVVGGK
jgi:hypothetical protein